MNRVSWPQVAVFAAVVVLVFAVGMGVLSSLWGGHSTIGPGMMRGYGGCSSDGMMGGYGGGLSV